MFIVELACRFLCDSVCYGKHFTCPIVNDDKNEEQLIPSENGRVKKKQKATIKPAQFLLDSSVVPSFLSPVVPNFNEENVPVVAIHGDAVNQQLSSSILECHDDTISLNDDVMDEMETYDGVGFQSSFSDVIGCESDVDALTLKHVESSVWRGMKTELQLEEVDLFSGYHPLLLVDGKKEVLNVRHFSSFDRITSEETLVWDCGDGSVLIEQLSLTQFDARMNGPNIWYRGLPNKAGVSASAATMNEAEDIESEQCHVTSSGSSLLCENRGCKSDFYDACPHCFGAYCAVHLSLGKHSCMNQADVLVDDISTSGCYEVAASTTVSILASTQEDELAWASALEALYIFDAADDPEISVSVAGRTVRLAAFHYPAENKLQRAGHIHVLDDLPYTQAYIDVEEAVTLYGYDFNSHYLFLLLQ